MPMLLRKGVERSSRKPHLWKNEVVRLPESKGSEAANDNARDVENKDVQDMEGNPEPMRTGWSVRVYRDRYVR